MDKSPLFRSASSTSMSEKWEFIVTLKNVEANLLVWYLPFLYRNISWGVGFGLADAASFELPDDEEPFRVDAPDVEVICVIREQNIWAAASSCNVLSSSAVTTFAECLGILILMWRLFWPRLVTTLSNLCC